MILIWSIGKLRNNKIFGNENFNINEVFIRVRRMMNEGDFRNEFIPGEDDKKEVRQVKEIYLVKW